MLIDHFISIRTVEGDKSAFTGKPMFVASSPAEGQVRLVPNGDRSVIVMAYGSDTSTPVLKQEVTAR
jgi:hypothetical protein